MARSKSNRFLKKKNCHIFQWNPPFQPFKIFENFAQKNRHATHRHLSVVHPAEHLLARRGAASAATSRSAIDPRRTLRGGPARRGRPKASPKAVPAGPWPWGPWRIWRDVEIPGKAPKIGFVKFNGLRVQDWEIYGKWWFIGLREKSSTESIVFRAGKLWKLGRIWFSPKGQTNSCVLFALKSSLWYDLTLHDM